MWRDELQRRCERAYDDEEKTAEKQNERIVKFNAEGHRHFTEVGKVADITADSVLRAKGQDGGEKKSMDQKTRSSRRWSRRFFYFFFNEITTCFLARFMDQ